MTKENNSTTSFYGINWDTVNGPLAIRMTNDYLFRALLQRNNIVLKALIASLLHLNIQNITSVKITNPIELGDAVDDKNFILDIKVELNENAVINLEMQVINEGDWAERSLCYLCRAFDNLNQGEKYKNVKPAFQIGLLDFSLFENQKEFYSTYHMRNDKTHELYSDKLTLSVLNLTQINLATPEDKHYNIDYWAKLFKATTWEELKMLAKSNQYMEEAAATVYRLTQEDKIRLQCEAREDYYRRTPLLETYETQKLENQQLHAKNQQLGSENQQLSSENQQLSSKNQQLSSEIQQLSSELERLKQKLAEQNTKPD